MSNVELREPQQPPHVYTIGWNNAKQEFANHIQQLLRTSAAHDTTFKQGRIYEANIHGLITTLGERGFQSSDQFRLSIPHDGHWFTGQEQATAVVPTRSFVNQMAYYIDSQYATYRERLALPNFARNETLTLWMLGQRTYGSYSVINLETQPRDEHGVILYGVCSLQQIPMK